MKTRCHCQFVTVGGSPVPSEKAHQLCLENLPPGWAQHREGTMQAEKFTKCLRTGPVGASQIASAPGREEAVKTKGPPLVDGTAEASRKGDTCPTS